MKAIAIHGSYRKNGNTATMIKMVTSKMRDIASQNQEDFHFEIVHLGHRNIGFCRGCRACFNKGERKCPLRDDLLGIYQKVFALELYTFWVAEYVQAEYSVSHQLLLLHLCHLDHKFDILVCLYHLSLAN